MKKENIFNLKISDYNFLKECVFDNENNYVVEQLTCFKPNSLDVLTNIDFLQQYTYKLDPVSHGIYIDRFINNFKLKLKYEDFNKYFTKIKDEIISAGYEEISKLVFTKNNEQIILRKSLAYVNKLNLKTTLGYEQFGIYYEYNTPTNIDNKYIHIPNYFIDNNVITNHNKPVNENLFPIQLVYCSGLYNIIEIEDNSIEHSEPKELLESIIFDNNMAHILTPISLFPLDELLSHKEELFKLINQNKISKSIYNISYERCQNMHFTNNRIAKLDSFDPKARSVFFISCHPAFIDDIVEHARFCNKKTAILTREPDLPETILEECFGADWSYQSTLRELFEDIENGSVS